MLLGIPVYTTGGWGPAAIPFMDTAFVQYRSPHNIGLNLICIGTNMEAAHTEAMVYWCISHCIALYYTQIKDIVLNMDIHAANDVIIG